ncbi:MAG: transcription antitermination factor NusB [Candidatus Gracilibacteria bacterium]|nr:transcription antitermination factor NusB [Candidatus Gracilibacteria bacterium]MDQ7022694.1 transcription antitermination factor NusB [Candidatus Gracilibacteria bacterium]
MPEDKTTLSGDKGIKTNNRKKTRKYLYQKIYASTFSKIDNAEFDNTFYGEVFDFDLDSRYLEDMLEIIQEKEGYLLKIISLLAPKFKIKSMGNHYIIPIFIGAAEMLFLEEEIPAKVSINEAIEMSKVYGDESSKRIVNGVMNKLYKDFDNIKEQLEEFDGNFGISIIKR